MLRLCKLLTSVKILLFSKREFLCHVQSTETYASVKSSCAQLPSPPPSSPRATAGHLPAFLVWVGGGGGGGHLQILRCPGAGHLPTPGQFASF